MSATQNLAGKTLFITGASRGIGLAIAKRAAQDGANIVIAAKSAEAHKYLPGTIYTAAEEIESAGGKALPLVVDVRSEQSVEDAVAKSVNTFGGIDICVNNASAISLTRTPDTQMKRFDLMHQVNSRGTFLVTKACMPHLLKADNPHVLMLSPPLDMHPKWFKNHTAYSMAKYGMSMCVLGMAAEFKDQGVGINALWPRTAIATSAVEFALGGEKMMRQCRSTDILADSAHLIFTQPATQMTGNFFIDDTLLAEHGVTDFEKYRVDPSQKLFCGFLCAGRAGAARGCRRHISGAAHQRLIS